MPEEERKTFCGGGAPTGVELPEVLASEAGAAYGSALLKNHCWNGGENPDTFVLKELFARIKSKELLLPWYGVEIELDYNKMGALGYSVGGHMVSRFVNSFPLMTFKAADGTPTPFPVVKA